MTTKTYNGDVALESRVRVIEAILEERQKQLDLTAEGLKDKLYLLNELRGDVITKAEYHKALEAIVWRVESLEKTHSKFVGVTIAMVAIASVVGGIVSHVFFK